MCALRSASADAPVIDATAFTAPPGVEICCIGMDVATVRVVRNVLCASLSDSRAGLQSRFGSRNAFFLVLYLIRAYSRFQTYVASANTRVTAATCCCTRSSVEPRLITMDVAAIWEVRYGFSAFLYMHLV